MPEHLYHVMVSAHAIVSQLVLVEAESEEEAQDLAQEQVDATHWHYDYSDGVEDIIGATVLGE